MFFFAEHLLAQPVFLEKYLAYFRQQKTILADNSWFSRNPDYTQYQSIHDNRIIDALTDTICRPVILYGLDLTGPGGGVAGLVIRPNALVIGTGHNLPMTVNKIDVPADDYLG